MYFLEIKLTQFGLNFFTNSKSHGSVGNMNDVLYRNKL